MKYAIIAAGEGSRLASEGISDPKPLVKVGGECLIDRLFRIFMDNDAEEIVVICRAGRDSQSLSDIDPMTKVAQHLVAIQRDGLQGRPIPLRFIVKNTPSSMHSLFEISRFLEDGPFVLTTVDTIFREDEFADYVKAFRQTKGDGLMGVTDYIDDEKPLYVKTDDQLNITAFLDTTDGRCRYISGGIYGLHENALYTLHNCIARSEKRMRNFQRALVADGRKLKAWPFSKVLDIDHAGDIEKAEYFISAK